MQKVDMLKNYFLIFSLVLSLNLFSMEIIKKKCNPETTSSTYTEKLYCGNKNTNEQTKPKNKFLKLLQRVKSLEINTEKKNKPKKRPKRAKTFCIYTRSCLGRHIIELKREETFDVHAHWTQNLPCNKNKEFYTNYGQQTLKK